MVHRLFSELGGGRFVLLWGLSFLFGLSNRAASGTALLHLLSVLNDQYYFVFAVLPVFLFLCGSVLADDPPLVLLHHGTYGRYFFKKWQGLCLLSSALWLGQLVAILLSGVGLPWHGGWVDAVDGPYREVFSLLQAHFPTPWLAVLCCAVQLLFGYWLIALLSLWLGHFFSQSGAVKILMALYVLAILWIKLPILSRPPFVYLTGLNHWILLLHNLTAPWRLWVTAGVTALAVAGMGWSIRFHWQGRLQLPGRRPAGLVPYYLRLLFTVKNLLLLAGVVVLAASWFWLRGGPPESGTDWALRLFAGHGTGLFYPAGLMALLLMEVLPLWPLGALSAQAASERSAFLTIRLRRQRQLMTALLRLSACWLAAYGLLLLAAAVVPPLLLDLAPDWGLALQAVGLKLLDVLAQYLLLLTVLCLTGQAALGFGAVVAAHFLCVLPLPWLPVGLSSLVRLALPQTGGSVPSLLAALFLGILSVALLVWLLRWGAGRLLHHQGG